MYKLSISLHISPLNWRNAAWNGNWGNSENMSSLQIVVTSK